MLNERGMVIEIVQEARKNPLDTVAAGKLLGEAEEIVICRGSRYEIYRPKDNGLESFLPLSLGRSGTLRAPTLRLGKRLLVGFNEAVYAQFLR